MAFGSELAGGLPEGAGIIMPGDTRSFSERLAAAITMPRPEWDDLISAAAEETRLTRLTSSRTEAMADAAQHRIETVQRVTGTQLENPFRQGYLTEAHRRYDAARERGEDPGPRALAVRQFQRDIFNEQIDDVAVRHPDKASALSFFQPIEQQASAIATSAETRANQARAAFTRAGGGAVDEFAGELFGGLYGARRDPVSIASLAVGPGVAAGRTVLGRVFTAATAQGLTNVGLLALEKPAANQWRKERGLDDKGNLPSAGEVGLAFALGAVPGAGIQSVIEAKGLAALKRVMAGEAKPGDVERALRSLGVDNKEVADVLAAGRRELDADAAAVADIPPGATPSGAEQVLRHVLDPDSQPPAAVQPRVTAGATHDVALRAMEGSPDPITAAERLRADGALIESALASPRDDVRALGQLASLSDEAFGKLRDGADPLVGRVAAEATVRPEWHAEIMDAVSRSRPETIREAKLVAADLVDGMARREQLQRARLEQQIDVTEKAAAPQTRRAGGPAAKDQELYSLLEFLAHRGGISASDPLIADVLQSFGGKNPFIPGFGRLIRKDGARLDAAREAATLDRYLAGEASGGDGTRLSDLLDAIDREARGDKVYRAGREGTQSKAQLAAAAERNRHEIEQAIDETFDDLGIEHSSVPDKTRVRVLQLIEREGMTDPLAAYERAVMEETHYGAQKGENEPVGLGEDIPGWSVPDEPGPASRASGEPTQVGQDSAGDTARQLGESDRATSDPLTERLLPKADGTAELVSADAAAAVGERESLVADLIRSCKP